MVCHFIICLSSVSIFLFTNYFIVFIVSSYVMDYCIYQNNAQVLVLVFESSLNWFFLGVSSLYLLGGGEEGVGLCFSIRKLKIVTISYTYTIKAYKDYFISHHKVRILSPIMSFLLHKSDPSYLSHYSPPPKNKRHKLHASFPVHALQLDIS